MDKDGITHVQQFACPRCGYQINAVGVTTGEPSEPHAGDANGCIACGCPMVFAEDVFGTGALSLRMMTSAEFDALDGDTKRELGRIAFFAQHVFQPARASRNN